MLPRVEAKLEHYPNDPDVTLNTSSAAVVLNMPSMPVLLELWGKFKSEFRRELLTLWAMRHEEVATRFGQLRSRLDSAEARSATIWGLVPRSTVQTKGFARIRNAAAITAICDAQILTREECGKVRFKRSEGVAEFMNNQPHEKQLLFLKQLLRPGCILDDVVRTNQGTELGVESLGEALHGFQVAEDALSFVASAATANLKAPVGPRGGTRTYAPIWFATYLAREKVWLLPLACAEEARDSYPTWARPIQMWLCFPPAMRDFADRLMRDHLAREDAKSMSSLVPSVALSLAAASDIWHADGLRAGPLIGYKRVALSDVGHSPEQRSWAVNRIWEGAALHHGLPTSSHPDAHAFVLSKRLVTKGTRPFNWIHNPAPRNLRRYERLYGAPPTEIPSFLLEWADYLEDLLPLFRVEAVDLKVKPLDLWLLYLAGHPSPPRTFQEIRRPDHIDSRGDPTRYCFKQFLKENFSDSSASYVASAMATLRQAWALAAERDGFDAALANPIQAADSPFEQRKHNSRTSRKAMDARVLEIVARENMRDGMAFARALGSKQPLCWRDVRHPETGELTKVFFPAAPTLVDIILHTGMRGMQGRWLDSGEGDEFLADLEGRVEVLNPSPAAIRGRRESFLRLCSLLGDTKETVVGMWVNSGKSGPHEVPWIHERLLAPVGELIKFQAFWNPIAKPVAIERDIGFDSRLKKFKGDSFPLMRDPANPLGHPISPERIRSYWVALLEHCQPIVDAELGYHYPLLLVDGAVNFDIHSLRVSVITTLLDHGVPVSVVQMLVGHKSPLMTWYYQDITNHKIHSSLQALLQRRKETLNDPHSLSEEDQHHLTSEAITFRTEDDFVGAEMLQRHRETGAFIDVFSHGICPGGNCEKGGEKFLEGKYKPVWRPRACSGCRFRVTGPAFLNGLVQRANSLMWEIKSSMRKEAEINLEIEAQEDAGRPVAHLRSGVRHEQEIRDALYGEWCLELRTIKRAEAALRGTSSGSGEGSKSLITGYDARQVDTRFREVHEFELAQRLAQDAVLTDGMIDLPADVLHFRDAALHRIAHANHIGDYFYSLDQKSAREALNLFGEMLVSHGKASENLQQIIDGSLLLSEIPDLQDALSTSLATIEGREQPSLTTQ